MTRTTEAVARETRFWMWLYVASFLASTLILGQTFYRLTDGDDALYHYTAGLKSWADIFKECFLPAEHPAFVFSRWRPMGTVFFPKLMWVLSPSTELYKISVWLICWLSNLAFAWSTIRVLGLAIPLAPGAFWAIATLAWWSAPTLILSSLVVPGVLGIAAGHWAVGLLSNPGQGARRFGIYAFSALLALISFQSYEADWFFFLWLGGWLLALRLMGARPKNAAVFWWPLLLVAAHVLIYRSMIPPQALLGAGNPDGFAISLNPKILASGFFYFVLAVLNGFAHPLDALARIAGPGLDTTPAAYPMAFILTLAALWVGWRVSRLTSRKARPSARQRKVAFTAIVGILAVVAATSVPYWVISNMRFIYFARIASGFFAVGFVFWIGRGKRIPRLPVALLIAGNALAASQATLNWNWTDVNFQDSMDFVRTAMAKPGFSECTSENPCCVRMSSRRWARNEWTLNWVQGAEKDPKFYPENWPGAKCAKTLIYD